MNVFQVEACNIVAEHDLSLSQIMRETWESGGVWFWHGIMSINAMSSLFTDHICPRFSSRLLFSDEELFSRFWSEDSGEVVERKVKENEKYTAELKSLFSTNMVDR